MVQALEWRQYCPLQSLWIDVRLTVETGELGVVPGVNLSVLEAGNLWCV